MDRSNFRKSSNVENAGSFSFITAPFKQAYYDLTEHPFETAEEVDNKYWEGRIKNLKPGPAPPGSLEGQLGYNSIGSNYDELAGHPDATSENHPDLIKDK